jgi:hypothetical protein
MFAEGIESSVYLKTRSVALAFDLRQFQGVDYKLLSENKFRFKLIPVSLTLLLLPNHINSTVISVNYSIVSSCV